MMPFLTPYVTFSPLKRLGQNQVASRHAETHARWDAFGCLVSGGYTDFAIRGPLVAWRLDPFLDQQPQRNPCIGLGRQAFEAVPRSGLPTLWEDVDIPVSLLARTLHGNVQGTDRPGQHMLYMSQQASRSVPHAYVQRETFSFWPPRGSLLEQRVRTMRAPVFGHVRTRHVRLQPSPSQCGSGRRILTLL